MRLICPNCGAQYEVPDDAIPAGGRDVQCSNCAHTWLELPGGSVAAEAVADGVMPDDAPDDMPDDALADAPVTDEDRDTAGAEKSADGAGGGAGDADDPTEDADTPDAPAVSEAAATLAAVSNLVSGITLSKDTAPTVPAAEAATNAAAVSARTPVRQPLSPTVAEILREEAAREEAARRGAAGTPMESQPDLDLDRPLDRDEQLAEESRRRMARIRGEQAPTTSAPVTATSGSRSDLLPDIEEISSSLRSTSERAAAEALEPEPEVVAERNRRGFRFGFFVVTLIFVVLALLYVLAPRISAAVPQAKPALDAYVETVDGGRLWLSGQVQALRASDEAATPEAAPDAPEVLDTLEAPDAPEVETGN